jgi:hypothetical protein
MYAKSLETEVWAVALVTFQVVRLHKKDRAGDDGVACGEA